MDKSKEKYRIFIVIVVYRRLKDTILCLESLTKQKYSNFKVIVVDHCESDQETIDSIRGKYPQFVAIKGNDSMWWTAATNFGIEYVLNNYDINYDYDLVLTLNNDLTVMTDYLTSLVSFYLKNIPCMVGSVSVDERDLEKLDFAGNIWNKFTTRIRSAVEMSKPYSEIKGKGVIASDTLPGRGSLYPIKLIEEIGFYDVESFPHYASDYDFSLRAKKVGYSLLISTESVVYSKIDESGLRFDKSMEFKPTLSNFLLSQTSIKSPSHYKTRLNWAKKHARLPLVYFAMDNIRILIQFARYFLKYHFSHR